MMIYGTNICPGNGNGLISIGDSVYARNHLIYEDFIYDVRLVDGNGVAGKDHNMFPRSYGKKIAWILRTNEDLGNNHPKIGKRNTIFISPLPGVIKPSLAYKMDKKLDDGYPATGQVWGGVEESGANTCTDATGNVTANAKYDISKDSSTIVCKLKVELN